MKSNPDRDRCVGLCAPYTMTQPPRLQFLWNLIEKINDYGLMSSFVEAGVYKGGSSMLMAYAANHLKMGNLIILYDTFIGMPEPTERDIKICKDSKGNTFFDKWREKQRDGYTDWCYGSYEEVVKNMRKTKNTRYVIWQGDVLETIPKFSPHTISLLRLDTDFYESTKHLMKHLFQRVEIGGFVVFDDYYHWKGARDAVDEYFKANKLNKKEIVQVDHSCAVYQVGGQR